MILRARDALLESVTDQLNLAEICAEAARTIFCFSPYAAPACSAPVDSFTATCRVTLTPAATTLHHVSLQAFCCFRSALLDIGAT